MVAYEKRCTEKGKIISLNWLKKKMIMKNCWNGEDLEELANKNCGRNPTRQIF